jgi:hypothetical protein
MAHLCPVVETTPAPDDIAYLDARKQDNDGKETLDHMFKGQMTREEEREHEKRFRANRKLETADARRRKARVLGVREDGKYVTVEFTNDAGERIIGSYSLYQYDRVPAAVWSKCLDNMRNATDPMTIIAAGPLHSLNPKS